MKGLISASKLNFLTVTEYSYNLHSSFDAATLPRPHFCMARLESGRAIFHDCESGENINVTPGDIIFVVQGGVYTSEWWGDPEIKYTSIHFSFEYSSSFPRDGELFLQKISSERLPQDLRERYSAILDAYNGERVFETLELFYGLLGTVSPCLRVRDSSTDPQIADAIRYIECNYSRAITVDELATHCRMSVSRFFPRFRRETGFTPIDYINRCRVNRAILLLIADTSLSVEEIAERTGFESSAYFRRVFKKQTGKAPREYRSSAIEI